jgi:hypothetical protein
MCVDLSVVRTDILRIGMRSARSFLAAKASKKTKVFESVPVLIPTVLIYTSVAEECLHFLTSLLSKLNVLWTGKKAKRSFGSGSFSGFWS